MFAIQILLNYCEQGKIIYLTISDYFEVKRVTTSCCRTKNKQGSWEKEMETPGQIHRELDSSNAQTISGRIPSPQAIDTKKAGSPKQMALLLPELSIFFETFIYFPFLIGEYARYSEQ
jgi:hypothetical protein